MKRSLEDIAKLAGLWFAVWITGKIDPPTGMPVFVWEILEIVLSFLVLLVALTLLYLRSSIQVEWRRTKTGQSVAGPFFELEGMYRTTDAFQAELIVEYELRGPLAPLLVWYSRLSCAVGGDTAGTDPEPLSAWQRVFGCLGMPEAPPVV